MKHLKNLLPLLLIPATLYLGTQLTGRAYYFTSTLIIIETMLPFFLSFEHRKPQARELVTLAVMCALAIASRVVILLPNFKPTIAFIMLTGIAMGPQAGFMAGAITAFASNFYFSQGPWTPWQMMAYGVGGFLAGMCFAKKEQPKAWVLAVFGFLAAAFVVGPLLDSCTLFTFGGTLSWRYAKAVFASGFIFNVQQALACAVTMLVLAKPMLNKLRRLREKYGIMDFGRE